MCFLCLKLLRPRNPCYFLWNSVHYRGTRWPRWAVSSSSLLSGRRGLEAVVAALMAGAPPGTLLPFQAGLWEDGAARCGKGDGPEPTQESASRAVVFSLQARDQEQRNLSSSLSAALVCFLFLISSWERPWAALLISCGRDEKVQKREAVISEKGLFTL